MAEAQSYTDWSYLYPPRPTQAIPNAMLGFFERKSFFAEIKKNGTCTVLGLAPDKQVFAFTRHNDRHKLWIPDVNSPALRALKTLPDKWFVFAGELLHSKGTGHKDTLYLFDLLVADSLRLEGTTRIARKERLFKMFPLTSGPLSHDFVDERLWLAKPILSDFKQIWDSLEDPEDEGLVLKDPWAILESCGSPDANSGGQVKCRFRTKNYSH